MGFLIHGFVNTWLPAARPDPPPLPSPAGGGVGWGGWGGEGRREVRPGSQQPCIKKLKPEVFRMTSDYIGDGTRTFSTDPPGAAVLAAAGPRLGC